MDFKNTVPRIQVRLCQCQIFVTHGLTVASSVFPGEFIILHLMPASLNFTSIDGILQGSISLGILLSVYRGPGPARGLINS